MTYYLKVEDDVDRGTHNDISCFDPSLLEETSKTYFRRVQAAPPPAWSTHSEECTPCAYLDVVDVYVHKHAHQFWTEAFEGKIDPLQLEWSTTFEVSLRVCRDPDYQRDLAALAPRPLVLRKPNYSLVPGPEGLQ